jgi:hypothetical protein
MNQTNHDHKILRMHYSAKELSAMLDVSYTTFRRELRQNTALYGKLASLGWRDHKRFRKAHVLEIFNVLGYTDGYEHYEMKSLEFSK